MAKAAAPRLRIATENRRARRDYFIDDTLDAGLVLHGTEVKALRQGRGSLADSYASEQRGELWLYNTYIPEYAAASHFSHETRRPRKLLLHRREIDRLISAVRQDGVTVVPLKIYFTERGIAKVQLGVARGKRKYDKRETIKAREWGRQKARLIRDKG